MMISKINVVPASPCCAKDLPD